MLCFSCVVENESYVCVGIAKRGLERMARIRHKQFQMSHISLLSFLYNVQHKAVGEERTHVECRYYFSDR